MRAAGLFQLAENGSCWESTVRKVWPKSRGDALSPPRSCGSHPPSSLHFGFRLSLAQSMVKHTTSESPIHSTYMEAVTHSELTSLAPVMPGLHSPLSSMLIVLSTDSTWQWMYNTRPSRGSATIGMLLCISVYSLEIDWLLFGDERRAMHTVCQGVLQTARGTER